MPLSGTGLAQRGPPPWQAVFCCSIKIGIQVYARLYGQATARQVGEQPFEVNFLKRKAFHRQVVVGRRNRERHKPAIWKNGTGNPTVLRIEALAG